MSEIVPETKHWGPSVSVQIMDGASRSDQKVVPLPQLPQRRANFHSTFREINVVGGHALGNM